VCTGCSQGCNTVIETRDNTVIRLKPRPNTEVNQYFICDHGRLDYRWINRLDRLHSPAVRRDGVMSSSDWETAINAAAHVIKGKPVHAIVSPRLSNEALYLVSRIVKLSGGRGVYRMPEGNEAPLEGVEDLALRSDRAPNGMGAELNGFSRVSNPAAGLKAGEVVLIVDEELGDLPAGTLAAAAAVVVVGTVMPTPAAGAVVVLPIANFSEEEGTFTNLRGRVQRFLQARAAPGMARPSWYVLADLAAALGERSDFLLPSQVFSAMSGTTPAFSGLVWDALGLSGTPENDSVAAGAAR
jgi:NADH-quinone oxidoreductase subunit G